MLSSVIEQVLLRRLAGSQYFRMVARQINRLTFFNHDIPLNIHGAKMYVRTPDRLVAGLLWKYSLLEPYETSVVKRMVKPGMCIYDIGANIGYYTVLFSSLVGTRGRVYAFEPEPENVRLLQKNITSNNIPNIVVVPMAVSKKNGTAKFYVCGEHKGNHTLCPPNQEWKTITVPTVTIDTFVKINRTPQIIKMDMEGAESLAFKGMTHFIKHIQHLTIFCEFSPDAISAGGCSPHGFLRTVKQNGFRILRINEKDKQLESITPEGILRFCEKNTYTNLLFTK